MLPCARLLVVGLGVVRHCVAVVWGWVNLVTAAAVKQVKIVPLGRYLASTPRSTRAQLLQRAIELRSRVIKSGDCIKICSALQLAATSAHIFKIEIHTSVFQCLCHFAIDLCRMMSLTEKLWTVIEEILPVLLVSWASLAAVP